jgi:nitroreductase
MDICLVAQQGVFRYLAGDHTLLPLLAADLRSSTGTQSFVSIAPVDLVYVSNYDRIPASSEECLQWSWAHSGCIAQNVYLACASLGLATVVRSSVDRAMLGAQMGLGPAEHITLSQTIGYPA